VPERERKRQRKECKDVIEICPTYSPTMAGKEIHELALLILKNNKFFKLSLQVGYSLLIVITFGKLAAMTNKCRYEFKYLIDEMI
jgi:hypothetical protein